MKEFLAYGNEIGKQSLFYTFMTTLQYMLFFFMFVSPFLVFSLRRNSDFIDNITLISLSIITNYYTIRELVRTKRKMFKIIKRKTIRTFVDVVVRNTELHKVIRPIFQEYLESNLSKNECFSPITTFVSICLNLMPKDNKQSDDSVEFDLTKIAEMTQNMNLTEAFAVMQKVEKAMGPNPESKNDDKEKEKKSEYDFKVGDVKLNPIGVDGIETVTFLGQKYATQPKEGCKLISNDTFQIMKEIASR